MKKIKLMLALCMLMVCGCKYMNEDKSFTLDEVEVSIIEYMETKYGQEFELTDIGYNSIISKEVNARVISLDDERKNEINVNWIYEEGEEIMDDNYTHLLYKMEANELVDSLISNCFLDYDYVSFTIIDNVPIDVYDKSITLKELAKIKNISIDITLLLNEEELNNEEKIKEDVLQMYEEVKKETNMDVEFSIEVLICDNNSFYENKDLIKEYKKLYSIDVSEANLTYNDKENKIFKRFMFVSSRFDIGVEEL